MYNLLKSLLIGTSIPYTSPIDRGILGHGITLVPIDDPRNNIQYGHLYRNGIKLSNTIFRIGGLCNGFNNKPYCGLIKYEKIGATGNHCIIDANGDVVLTAQPFDSVYYKKGCIAIMKDTYYNLKTGKPIITGGKSISSEHYLFVESSSFWNKEQKDGVYKIEYSTGEFEVIS